MNPIVLKMIEERLKKDGFDGLFNNSFDSCACTIKDGLAPCNGFQHGCEAGYEIPGTGEFEGTFEVVREKEKHNGQTQSSETDRETSLGSSKSDRPALSASPEQAPDLRQAYMGSVWRDIDGRTETGYGRKKAHHRVRRNLTNNKRRIS